MAKPGKRRKPVRKAKLERMESVFIEESEARNVRFHELSKMGEDLRTPRPMERPGDEAKRWTQKIKVLEEAASLLETQLSKSKELSTRFRQRLSPETRALIRSTKRLPHIIHDMRLEIAFYGGVARDAERMEKEGQN